MRTKVGIHPRKTKKPSGFHQRVFSKINLALIFHTTHGETGFDTLIISYYSIQIILHTSNISFISIRRIRS
jgi:hypothetical protein